MKVQVKKNNKVIEVDTADFINEISLRAQFVELVNKSEISAEQKQLIVEYGLNALSGQEVGA